MSRFPRLSAATTVYLAAAVAALAVLSFGPLSSDSPRSEPSAVKFGRSPKTYISASVLPTSTYSVGNSLPDGPLGKSFGYAVQANGVDNAYTVPKTSKATYDFLIFVFSNEHSQKRTVAFNIVSPSNRTVFQYSFKPQAIFQGGTWYTIAASGDFRAAGTYFAEVHSGNSLIGWLPLDFVR